MLSRSNRLRYIQGAALLRAPPHNPVFRFAAGGFGDVWAATSYLLRLSAATGRPARVTGACDLALEIAGLLATTGTLEPTACSEDIVIGSPQLLSAERPSTILPWSEVFRQRYLPTLLAWRPNVGGKLCAHFTPSKPGSSSCSIAQIEVLRVAVARAGYEITELGAHLTLSENINVAASSEFFIGIDSGLSHLAHSVGVPVHLVRNQLPIHHLRTTHRGNDAAFYRSLPDFVANGILAAFPR